MAPRPAQPAATTSVERNDDLSLIRHVGPGTIKRLHDGGVTTLTALAAKTPDELAVASGYSASKIEKEDWIGQALRLTGGQASSALVVAPRPDPSHRVVTFRLELTVEPDGKVHHSDITCLQDDTRRDHWTGWDTDRVASFVSDVAKLDVINAATDVVTTPASVPALALAAGRTVEPSSYRLEIQTGDEVTDRRTLTPDAAADVILDVALQGLVTRPTKPVRHRVEVTAVEVGGGERHLIATSSATEQYDSGELSLRIPASLPPAGIYRLLADVTVAAADAKAKSASARLRSGPILVR